VSTTETFGAALRRLRVSAGLTQERLAERSGISADGVAALEAGRRKTPRLNTVGLLCDALGVDSGQRAMLIAAATRVDAPRVQPAQQATAQGALLQGPWLGAGRSFVGRQAELKTLKDAWERRTRVAMLSGEAGVGKSALIDEFAADCARSGVTVLAGRSTPQQLGVFEAFIEPVRAALERFGNDVPTKMRDLGRLVPGLIEASVDVLVPTRSDPAVERRLLFESVATLFGSAGPTLLLLDDLHCADPGTLDLLSFLAARQELSNLMIVCTIRSTDVTTSTSALLAELRRHCTVVRLQVTGLSRAELAELVGVVAGPEVSDALISAVGGATNGNPLFIRELTEHLLRHGLDEGGAPAPIPEGIRDTIELRVAGLSSDGQTLLRGGAVLGQAFDLDLAGRLVGLDGEALLSAVEDTLLSGLAVERSATVAVFSHGLVATAIYEGMPRSRRLALHRSAATSLAERAPVAAGEIVDVARHWSIVASEDPTARSIASRWSVRAGDAASASASIDEAIACYQRAVAIWDEPTGEYADTLVRLGSALTTVGRLIEGKEHLLRALQIAEQAEDAIVFARAALELSATVPYTQSDPARIRELEAAIIKLGPTEMVLRPALLATLRRQLAWVDTPEADRRRQQAAALLDEAVSSPDVSEELLISLGGLRDSQFVDDPIPMGRLARDILRVADARRDLPVLATAWFRQAYSALELGEAELFRRSVDEYRQIAQRLRRPYELALASGMISAVAQIEGRYDEAEAAGLESLAHASTIADENFGWTYFANSGLRAADLGHIAVTFELMQAVRSDFGRLATFEASLAAVAAAAGDSSMVDQLFGEQLGDNGEIIDRNWSYLSSERIPVVGFLAWASGVSGNVRRSSILRDRLLRIAEIGVRAIRVGPVGAWCGPIDHHIGALSRVLGDLDRAEHHLHRALIVEDEMNGRPFRVRTMVELAMVARQRGGSIGVASGDKWRGEAEDLAVELGLESIFTTMP
jgi:transcriptional regulator with XRE-family HTH domain/tetratricopeptide (TPR) repeat protein